MNRRSRSAITLGTLGVLCVLALVLGFVWLTSPLPDEPLIKDPPPSCEMRTVAAGTSIKSDEITVSVYNASKVNGLASDVMTALINRGFARGESGNTPDEANAKVKKVQVWAAEDNEIARFVASQFGPGTPVKTGRRALGLGIEVIVGADYSKLAKAPRSLVVKERTSFCSPPVTDDSTLD